jgi:hypothetical protein
MKQIIILSLVLFTRLVAQDYFPLEVGNTWIYYVNSYFPDTMTYHVSDSLNIDHVKYFLYGMFLPSEYNFKDTIRKDAEGNIWKKVNGVDYLWFDFTKDSGAVYTFPDHNSSYYYNVEVVDKNFTLQTNRGNYSHCIKFLFDIPQFVDDEVFYSFAPEMGIIEMYGGDGPQLLLDSASIIRTPNGIIYEQSSSSNLFELTQNYPNPFNPSTTINYSIPKTSFVTIKVYNILGKEIATLVNQEKLQGNYDIEFNASGLPSGIYFYRMQAGSFVSTKKLLLLK